MILVTHSDNIKLGKINEKTKLFMQGQAKTFQLDIKKFMKEITDNLDYMISTFINPAHG